MGNLNCYEQKENEKVQIKSYNPVEILNIDEENFFIDNSYKSIPLEYSQTNKDENIITSFEQINKTNKLYKQEFRKINYSKSFDSKLTRNKFFTDFKRNILINNSLVFNKNNQLKLPRSSSKNANNKTQILKIITVNNFFPKNNNIIVYNIKNNFNKNFSNFPNDKLTNEKIKNISANKIQRKYRCMKNKINYRKNIRPKLIKESRIYIQNILDIILEEKQFFDEEQNQIEPYNITNYQKFYKKNDPFFIYNYGKVFNNQIRIEKISQDYSIYQGEMNIENQKHGFGKLITKKYTLIGTWRKNKFTGWGRETDNNENYLEAKFINGLANGKGILVHRHTSRYIGDFVNSLRCGKGELITNKIYYKGDFLNDAMHGFGKIIFLKEGHKYEGQFKNNRIEGWGILYWKNGDRYEGQVKNGKMHGKGKYYYKDGKIYEGIFINGNKK